MKKEIKSRIEDCEKSGGKILDLSSLNIRKIPSEILSLKNIEVLDLSSNSIRILPDSVNQFQNLSTINLSNNKIELFPTVLSTFQHIKKIEIVNCKLASIPDDIKNFENLEYIDLSDNKLVTVPYFLKYSLKIQHIDLNGNLIEKIPDFFEKFQSLKSLNLGYNSLYELPNSFENLNNLITLNLEFNDFEELPNAIVGLKKLESLKLDGNKINFQNLKGGFKNLQSLSLVSAGLTKIPESIFNLDNLLNLDLSNNTLVALPDFFNSFHNLQVLDLSRCRIFSLPESFSFLSNLQDLLLIDNYLTQLPESFGKLSNLQNLDLSDNILNTLPESFGHLSSLQDLDLSNNFLNSLPESFKKLKNLQTIDLKNNRIEFLPDCFDYLLHLQKLDLSGNYGVKTLPNSIALLPKLKYFSYEEHNLPNDSLFKNYGLAQIRESLMAQRIKKSKFPIPQELRNAFQKYFSGFDEFFKDIKGSEINFTVKKVDDGLEFEMGWDDSITYEEVQIAFQNYFNQLAREVPLIQAYSEIEYNKIQLAKLEMKQEAEILGFKQQIKVLEIYNHSLAEEVRRLISEMGQSNNKLLVLETEKRMLLAHNQDLKEVTLKPIQINVYTNTQIISDFENFIKLLSKEHFLTADLQKDATHLKEVLLDSKSEKEIKTKSKGFFRKVLDFIKDTKTVTKDLQDTGNWFIDKYDWIKENLENLPVNEIIYHLKELMQNDMRNLL